MSTKTEVTTKAPGLRLLAVLIGLGILSTTAHYSHNFVMADCYPPIGFINSLAYQIGIAVFWPICTALALRGYCLYAHGRNRETQLALYGYTPGPFLAVRRSPRTPKAALQAASLCE